MVLACLFVAGIAWFVTPPSSSFTPLGRRWPRLVAFTIIGGTAAWICFQCMPLPVPILAWAQPMARQGYNLLFSPDEWTSIGFSRFDIASEATLWGAYILLVWTSMRAIRTRDTVRRTCFALAAIGSAQALAGIFSKGSGPGANQLFSSDRITGTFSGSNSFAGFLSLSLLVTLGLILATVPRIFRESKGRSARIVIFEAIQSKQLLPFVLLSLAFIVQSVAILVSGSRGATISVSVMATFLMLWFFVESRRGRRGHAITVLAPVLALAVLTAIVPVVAGPVALPAHGAGDPPQPRHCTAGASAAGAVVQVGLHVVSSSNSGRWNTATGVEPVSGS